MIREPQSGVATHRAPLVELRDALPPAGEVLAEVVRRDRDVVLPDRLRGRDLHRGVLPHQRRADVRAGRDELQPIERRAHLLRRSVVVAGELHVLVADLRDLRERAVEVRLELIADGVELQPDHVRARRAGGRRARARRRRAHRRRAGCHPRSWRPAGTGSVRRFSSFFSSCSDTCGPPRNVTAEAHRGRVGAQCAGLRVRGERMKGIRRSPAQSFGGGSNHYLP